MKRTHRMQRNQMHVSFYMKWKIQNNTFCKVKFLVLLFIGKELPKIQLIFQEK